MLILKLTSILDLVRFEVFTSQLMWCLCFAGNRYLYFHGRNCWRQWFLCSFGTYPPNYTESCPRTPYSSPYCIQTHFKFLEFTKDHRRSGSSQS